MELANTKNDRLIKTALRGWFSQTVADNVANVDTRSSRRHASASRRR
jgi:hypothetical protein